MKPKITLDIIMNSSLNKNVGGRETWLYNFLPELLKDPRFSKVSIFGFRVMPQGDFSTDLNKFDSPDPDQRRLYVHIFEGEQTRLPKAHSMYKALKVFGKNDGFEPDYVLAVGVFEMLMIHKIRRYKNAKKIIWLRSIFSHEKTYAIPSFLRKFVLSYEIRKLKKADIVLGNGDDIRDFYSPFGIDVEVIKNGVAMQKWEMSPPALNGAIHIAYVGRLSQVKGIEDYLSLIEKVKLGIYKDDFVFHIVGDNSTYKERVSQLVANGFAINHNNIPNDNLPQFLQDIDVCVALTYASSEGGGGGTSNAMMEQMAAGRVMLAWNNRIFSQYLNEKNAYLTDQFSVEGLENELYNIFKDKQLAKSKAENGKKTMLPYSYAVNVAKFKKSIGLN